MSKVKKEKFLRIMIAIILIAILMASIGFLFAKLSKNRNHSEKEIKIVASNYVAYDFARAIVGESLADQTDIKILLKPGSEMHSFEPTPEDVANLSRADLIVYNGGESEEWFDKLLDTNEVDKNKAIKMMDLVELQQNDEGEYDEHIWTSPKNAITLVDKIKEKMIEKYPDKKEIFEANTGLYRNELQDIDSQLRLVISDANKNKLVFADRFPFLYLADDYGLDYLAAFPGCSEQTEADSKTVAKLIDEIRNGNINVILKIELTNDSLAQAIAEATGAKIRTLNSAHNISQEDFDKNIKLTDIMRDNLVVIREALD